MEQFYNAVLFLELDSSRIHSMKKSSVNIVKNILCAQELKTGLELSFHCNNIKAN